MRFASMLILAASTASASGEPAGNASPVPGLRADFMALDRNRDGLISRFEANGDHELVKRFALFDANKDGVLSEDEFVRAKEDYQQRVLRDLGLVARVKAALLAEKGVPSSQISVHSYEGRVQLSGFVEMPEMASRAGRVAASVSGVKTVHNNIAIK
jgi:hypothetical protein